MKVLKALLAIFTFLAACSPARFSLCRTEASPLY